MNKTFASALFGAIVNAVGPGQAIGYSQGVPPTTQNCNSFPKSADGSGDMAAQSIAWGLEVDREFGGCKCADDGAEFKLDVDNNNRSRWHCQCVSTDQYVNQPFAETIADANSGKIVLDDRNGKTCGIIRECQSAAMTQQ